MTDDTIEHPTNPDGSVGGNETVSCRRCKAEFVTARPMKDVPQIDLCCECRGTCE